MMSANQTKPPILLLAALFSGMAFIHAGGTGGLPPPDSLPPPGAVDEAVRSATPPKAQLEPTQIAASAIQPDPTGLALWRNEQPFQKVHEGPRGKIEFVKLFWQPLRVVHDAAGRSCRVQRLDQPPECQVDCEQLFNLPTRIFIKPQRIESDASPVWMTTSAADPAAPSVRQQIASPVTVSMPPQSIMPYPLIALDTNGQPILIAPLHKTLHEWTVEAPQLPLDSAWTLLSKTALTNMLDIIAECELNPTETGAPPAAIQSTIRWLCADTTNAHALLNAIGYIPEKRASTRALLTRKFKALERKLADPEVPALFWIKLDELP
ncbi:MAG: hypothetical protein EOM20_04120 [Spartobacteria bacterium]|nr:hypothetical protein [Spartobacteria bacterium]